MYRKIITILIAGIVAVLVFTAATVFAGENFNSSKSNDVTGISIDKIHQYVGDILLLYGVGGMEINRVNDALDAGIAEDALRAMLGEILGNIGLGTAGGEGVSDKVQAIILEFEKLALSGKGAQAVSPGIGDTPPSAAGEPTPTAPTPEQPTARSGEVIEFKDGDDLIQRMKAAESDEQREKIRKELQTSRQAFRENIRASRQNIRERAQDLRDNFRENVKTTIGHVDHGKTARIAVAHGNGLRMINRFRSAMARFDHILDRLESRIEKIGIEIEAQARAKGKIQWSNPPENKMIALIEEAKNMQALNEARLVELQAKYESLLLGENAGGIAEEARAIAKELKTEIENLHGILRQIADDVKQASGDYNSSISNSSSERISLIKNTIEKVRERLKSCDTEVCVTVGDHAKKRTDVMTEAEKAIKNGSREEATRLLREVRGIVLIDIEILGGLENSGSIAGVLELERSLLNYVDSTLVLIK